MNLSLLIHNIGYVTSAVISLSLGLFVLSRGWGKRDYILYFLTTLTFVIYCIAHVLGVNATDPVQSKIFLLITNIVLFTVCLTAHFGFSIFKKVYPQRWGLMFMYACATLLTVWVIRVPELFIVDSIPKQFFPNFLNPGPFYWVFAVFFLMSALYMFSALGLYYYKMDKIDRNRLTYFFMAFGYVYVIGSLFFLPIFGIEISMLPTAFIGLYTIPLA